MLESKKVVSTVVVYQSNFVMKMRYQYNMNRDIFLNSIVKLYSSNVLYYLV